MTALGVILIAVAAMLIISALRGEDIRDVLRDVIAGRR